MNKNIKVSIIIPVYNVEQYLRQCLDSIIQQTFRDFECICINDCSTDNSRSILEEYAKKDDRFIVINLSENKGQGEARNYGLNIAKGKYITFVDSDDWVTSDYLEVLHKAIEKYNTDFVSAKTYFFDNTTNITAISSRKPKISFNTIIYSEKDRMQIIRDINILQASTVWGNIYNRSFFSSNNMSFKPIKFEDTLFMWEAFIKAQNFVFIEDIIYFYRMNRKNSTMDSFSVEDRMLYHNQLIDLNKREFNKKYLSYCYTYILLRSATMTSYLPLEKAKLLFAKMKESFNYINYIIDYTYPNFVNKIRLFLFIICLKYNFKMSFIYLGRLLNKFKTMLGPYKL